MSTDHDAIQAEGVERTVQIGDMLRWRVVIGGDRSIGLTLAAWVEAHPKGSPAAVRHWLYQHTWIVTGARFGWSTGAEALRTLIAVDRRVQKLWRLGGRSEVVARNALAFVEQRSR